jgi:hypothetical protein
MFRESWSELQVNDVGAGPRPAVITRSVSDVVNSGIATLPAEVRNDVVGELGDCHISNIRVGWVGGGVGWIRNDRSTLLSSKGASSRLDRTPGFI